MIYDLVVEVDRTLKILQSLDGVDQVQVQWRQSSPDGRSVDRGGPGRAAQAEVVLTLLVSGDGMQFDGMAITTGSDCEGNEHQCCWRKEAQQHHQLQKFDFSGWRNKISKECL